MKMLVDLWLQCKTKISQIKIMSEQDYSITSIKEKIES